ncbi:MAG: NPCBM/NEW2 domain-containing protein [Pirellulales bacterium]
MRDRVVSENGSSPLIAVGGRFFETGLFAHAPNRYEWRLNGGWKSLRTEYGLQDDHDGTVVFVIRADGNEVFRSNTVKDHTAREKTVDLTGVDRLELNVEDAADGTNSDWGVWLSPTLTR